MYIDILYVDTDCDFTKSPCTWWFLYLLTCRPWFSVTYWYTGSRDILINRNQHPKSIQMSESSQRTGISIWQKNDILILVGGIPTPLKNMSSSVGIMKLIWKVIKFHGSKPPTSYRFLVISCFGSDLCSPSPGFLDGNQDWRSGNFMADAL